jgi:hypothetical protein
MKKSRKADPRDGWYEVEPGDAQRLLDEQPPNRPLRESKAIRLGRDMTSGKWRANGEPLILDENGKLLDGQGRCRGSVISGKSFETYIIHGIPRRYFPSVDTGQNRLGADTLALSGAPNYVVASAVCRLALSCLHGSPTGQNARGAITNEQIRDFYKRNSERVDKAITDTQFPGCPLPQSILAYVYMEAVEIDPTKAQLWAAGIANGENLTAGSPMLLLRNRLIALKGEAHRLSSYEKLALAIKSWNAFVEDKSVGVLKWNRKGTAGRNAEPFPVMASV